MSRRWKGAYVAWLGKVIEQRNRRRKALMAQSAWHQRVALTRLNDLTRSAATSLAATFVVVGRPLPFPTDNRTEVQARSRRNALVQPDHDANVR